MTTRKDGGLAVQVYRRGKHQRPTVRLSAGSRGLVMNAAQGWRIADLLVDALEEFTEENQQQTGETT